MITSEKLIRAMIEYYAGDIKRINHFLKVYAFAKTIAEGEGLDADTRVTIEYAAIVHDIGIKVSEEKYNSSAGKYQELEGPPVARQMLLALGESEERTERICALVGCHHTYNNIIGIDHQILIEADFLVNLDEDGASDNAKREVRDKIFKTATGAKILDEMYFAGAEA